MMNDECVGQQIFWNLLATILFLLAGMMMYEWTLSRSCRDKFHVIKPSRT
jgi:hypothetical protein